MVPDGVVCLSKLCFYGKKSEFVCLKFHIFASPQEYCKRRIIYGKTEKTISVGQIPPCVLRKEADKEKAYPVELEYTWNRQIIRKTTNVFVKVADWNQNGNQGRGEIRAKLWQ